MRMIEVIKEYKDGIPVGSRGYLREKSTNFYLIEWCSSGGSYIVKVPKSAAKEYNGKERILIRDYI